MLESRLKALLMTNAFRLEKKCWDFLLIRLGKRVALTDSSVLLSKVKAINNQLVSKCVRETEF